MGVCNGNATGELAAIASGDSATEVIGCEQTFRVESKDACNYLYYGEYTEMAIATLNNFFGIFCIGFGGAMVFYGYGITKWVFRLLAFTILFGLLFGLIYNCMTLPELGVQIGVACACAIVAGIGTYFVDKFLEKWGVPLMLMMCGVFGGFFVSGLAKQVGIVSYIIVIVCAIAGLLVGMYVKVTLMCTLTASCGAGMLMYGISLEAGGFNATPWSLYAYLAVGVILALAGAIIQRIIFRNEGKKESKDEDGDGVNDNDVFDDEEERICGCF